MRTIRDYEEEEEMEEAAGEGQPLEVIRAQGSFAMRTAARHHDAEHDSDGGDEGDPAGDEDADEDDDGRPSAAPLALIRENRSPRAPQPPRGDATAHMRIEGYQLQSVAAESWRLKQQEALAKQLKKTTKKKTGETGNTGSPAQVREPQSNK